MVVAPTTANVATVVGSLSAAPAMTPAPRWRSRAPERADCRPGSSRGPSFTGAPRRGIAAGAARQQPARRPGRSPRQRDDDTRRTSSPTPATGPGAALLALLLGPDRGVFLGPDPGQNDPDQWADVDQLRQHRQNYPGGLLVHQRAQPP